MYLYMAHEHGDRYESFFISSNLKKMYHSGKLNYVIDKFPDVFRKNKFLGCGGDACCFEYDSNQVFKICGKHMDFFKAFGTNSAKKFKKIADQINFFLPINKIIYEDKYVFVYLQDKCTRADRKHTSKSLSFTILRFLIEMIESDIVIRPGMHNLGIHNATNSLIMFDYHAIFPIKWHHSSTTNRILKEVLTKYVTKYVCSSISSHNVNKYVEYAHEHQIDKFKHNKDIPVQLYTFLKYIFNHDTINKKQTLALIKDCMLSISHITN